MIPCPRCGKENSREAFFCQQCGGPLSRVCPKCGTANAPDAHFCLRCGTALSVEATVERRVVTVLFADLVESTSLVRGQDPERARAVIGQYFEAMRHEIESHGGVVEKFIGDAVMALFGVPVAHEDHAQRAVRAAIAMQRRLTTHNTGLSAPLRIRIGLSTGEVVADPQASATGGQFMVTGEVVNLAARLQQQAPPDVIVVDERTQLATRLIARYVSLPAPAGAEFASEPRWQLLGLIDQPPSKELRGPLLGRDSEMQLLHALYRRVVQSRSPHLVTILGDAGVGKTRLVDEFVSRLVSDAEPPAVLRGRCPAYGEGLTYWPFVEMLKQECQIKDSDSPFVASQKLQARLMATCEPALGREDCQPVIDELAALVGLPAGAHGLPWDGRLQALKEAVEGRAAGEAAKSDSLLRCIRAFLGAKARSAPLLLVFEDLHWAEQSLLQLLEQLVVRAPDGPVMIICLARPALLERHPDWGSRLRNYTAITLPALDNDNAQRLLVALLGEDTPQDLRDRVLARAEGNPFFLEEILHVLVDSGTLVRQNGTWRVSGPVEVALPDTIHGTIASRLDLLSPLERRVMQAAAVAGRVFWPGALTATAELHGAEVLTALARLQERDLVEERAPSSVEDERQFAFKHALVREVAYSTLPKSQRSTLHLAFARWLERTSSETEEFSEAVAHHYEQAWRSRLETGDPGANVGAEAARALRRAGRRAAELGAIPEADRLYGRALEVVGKAGIHDPALLCELLVERSDAVKWVFPRPELMEDMHTVLRLAPGIGRVDLVARAWLNLGVYEYYLGTVERADDALARALELFREIGNRRGEAETVQTMGVVTQSFRDRLSKAQAAFRRAIELFEEMGDHRGMARAMTRLGRALVDSGALADARPVLERAAAIAQRARDRAFESDAQVGLASIAHLTGDAQGAVQEYQQALEVARELEHTASEVLIRRSLAMHFIRYGRLDDAEREMELVMTLAREHAWTIPFVQRTLAELRYAQGNSEVAATHAEPALTAVEGRDKIATATYGATLGRIRAAQGRADEAEALFRRSLDILEAEEYRLDLALTLMKYGEALVALEQPQRAREVFGRARQMFGDAGATRFVDEIDTWLRRIGSPAEAPPATTESRSL